MQSKPVAVLLLISIVCVFGVRSATAQNYPNKPIRLIVANTPGTGQDSVARIMAPEMSGFMGHETDLELNMQGVKAFWRLGLDNEKCVHVMRDCADVITALRSALGD